MLYAGGNILSNADKLVKIPIDYLYHSVKQPKSEIESKIRQLRIIKNLDLKRYNLLKRELPYIVCGNFNPPYRKRENFSYIQYFILDIDHINEKGLALIQIKEKLMTDDRIVMLFVSPGEDGLKVMFKLEERCYDSGLYSIFYKTFLKQF